MELEPDAIHEGDGEAYIDCPQCGSPVTLTRIVQVGRCTGTLDAAAAEVEEDDQPIQETGCTAELSLELVWAA